VNPNYAPGRSGLGLLIQRVTVAAVILIIESSQLTSGWLTILSVAAMGLAVFIGMGLFTSLSSAIEGVLIIAQMPVSHAEPLLWIPLAALCGAIALMGGGAYSIDGLIHGRRRIILPDS
jgi:hypothetical protein